LDQVDEGISTSPVDHVLERGISTLPARRMLDRGICTLPVRRIVWTYYWMSRCFAVSLCLDQVDEGISTSPVDHVLERGISTLPARRMLDRGICTLPARRIVWTHYCCYLTNWLHVFLVVIIIVWAKINRYKTKFQVKTIRVFGRVILKPIQLFCNAVVVM